MKSVRRPSLLFSKSAVIKNRGINHQNTEDYEKFLNKSGFYNNTRGGSKVRPISAII